MNELSNIIEYFVDLLKVKANLLLLTDFAGNLF